MSEFVVKAHGKMKATANYLDEAKEAAERMSCVSDPTWTPTGEMLNHGIDTGWRVMVLRAVAEPEEVSV